MGPVVGERCVLYSLPAPRIGTGHLFEYECDHSCKAVDGSGLLISNFRSTTLLDAQSPREIY